MAEEIIKFKQTLKKILDLLGIPYDSNPDFNQTFSQLFVRLESGENSIHKEHIPDPYSLRVMNEKDLLIKNLQDQLSQRD